jgi:outer membrane lipase/esterase
MECALLAPDIDRLLAAVRVPGRGATHESYRPQLHVQGRAAERQVKPLSRLQENITMHLIEGKPLTPTLMTVAPLARCLRPTRQSSSHRCSGRPRSLRRMLLRFAATAMVAGVAVLGATLAPAQAQFTGIYGFGDSYADTGAGPGGAFRLAGAPAPCAVVPNPASCRFTGGTNFVDSLQTIYGLPTLTNYAIGGALTDNNNTLYGEIPAPNNAVIQYLGFPYELARLAHDGVRFTDRDLIALSIGGNDSSLLTGPASDARALATQAAWNAVNGGIVTNGTIDGVTYNNVVTYGVQQLIAAGARNIAWLSPGNSWYFPAPEGGSNVSWQQRLDFATTYYQQIQLLLQPAAQSGVRVFLFDFSILQQRIFNNPGQYGFASDPRCEASVNGSPANCFYQNTVHPTSAAMALIAAFMANQIDAPTTVVPQGGITTSIASGFTSSVFGRLDAERTFAPFGMGTAMAMAYAGPTKALGPVAPDKRWSIYGNVDYGSGSRGTQFLGSGYDYSSLGGTIGVDYRRDQNWKFGGAFSYANPRVDLGVQNAHNSVNAYQLAGYGSFTDAHWFADGLLAYGRQDFSLDRWGVTDAVTASTHADTFTAAARGGYLFDVGRLRAGPIGGLTYAHAVIQGYTETGDSLLIMTVDRQTLDNLTGDAGVQLRYPFVVGNGLYNPFINLTAEHEFMGSGRIVTTTLVSAPLLPVLTPVPDTGRTYGKVAAGVSAVVSGNVSATLIASTSFAREGGNDVGVSGGVKIAF